MQISATSLPKSEILIKVEVTTEELQKYEEEAASRISQNVDIPGFRKGQAPKAFVISHVGPDGFFQEVLNVALPQTYFAAVKEKNLQVISRPEVKVLEKSPLKYEAKVAILPEIMLKGYENIKIPEEQIAVTDEEINEVIEEMRKYRATYKPLERPIAKGDRLEIDFQGYDERGSALDKTKSSNHPLFVGEGSLVSGFEEELIGMEAGKKKKFPVVFSKDFHYEPLRGKTVYFETEIKRADETILPNLDEDFVSKVMGEKKTVGEFREALKTDLHRRKAVESRRTRENVLLERFLKEAKLEVSPVLVNEEVDYMIQDSKADIESRGGKFEQYQEELKKQGKDLRKEFTGEAEKRIRIRLILNYLFQKLAITVTDEEMARGMSLLLQRTPEAERGKLQTQLNAKTEVYLRLKNNLMLEKLFAKFLG